MKIIKQIDENTFIISLEDSKKIRGEKVIVAHDYVMFSGSDIINTDCSIVKEPLYGPHAFASNCISNPSHVQIPIRAMHKAVMSLLKEHKYMQPEHLADRTHTEDDQYWDKPFNKDLNLTGPRWLKGDKYPAYASYDQFIHYFKDGEAMVAVLMEGDREFNHVTKAFFEKFIQPNLKNI